MDGSSTLLISFCFSSEARLLAVFFGRYQVGHLAGDLRFLGLQPSVELNFYLLKSQSTLGHTAQQVFLHHYPFVRQNRTSGIRCFSTFHDPIQGAIKRQINGCRVGVGVVLTQTFNETTVALGAAVCYYNSEDGTTFAAVALEANACCHAVKFLKGSETRLLRRRKGTTLLETNQIVLQSLGRRQKQGVARQNVFGSVGQSNQHRRMSGVRQSHHLRQ